MGAEERHCQNHRYHKGNSSYRLLRYRPRLRTPQCSGTIFAVYRHRNIPGGMTQLMMVKTYVLVAIISALICPHVEAQAVSAQVSDSVWTALEGSRVRIALADDSTVEGELLSFGAESVVLVLADDQVVEIWRDEIQSVARITASEAAPEPPMDTTEIGPHTLTGSALPPTRMYWGFDPAGFLTFGPSLRMGFMGETGLGFDAAWRFLGLGGGARALFDNLAGTMPRVTAGGPEIGIVGHPQPYGDHWYWGVRFGLLFTGYTGPASSEFALDGEGRTLITYLSGTGGYKWRFENGFYVALGAYLGLGGTSGSQYRERFAEGFDAWESVEEYRTAILGLEVTMGTEWRYD